MVRIVSDDLLRFPLGLPVHVERIGIIQFAIRAALPAVKHEVGTDLHEPSPELPAHRNQVLHSADVHGTAQFDFTLRLIHLRVGSRVDHDLRTEPVESRTNRLAAGDIQLGQVQTDSLGVQQAAECAAQLPAAAGYEDTAMEGVRGHGNSTERDGNTSKTVARRVSLAVSPRNVDPTVVKHIDTPLPIG